MNGKAILMRNGSDQLNRPPYHHLANRQTETLPEQRHTNTADGVGGIFTTYLSRIILLLVSGLLFCHSAWSATGSRYIFAGVEATRWQEFNDADKRLLSENGPRLTLGAAWESSPGDQHIRFNANSHIYAAMLSYDGQTQSIDPNATGVYISSTSRYTGFSAELATLFDLGTPTLAGLLGIGVDLWRRDIDNASDAKGNDVSGFIEDYQLLYSKLGIQKEIRGIYGRSKLSIGIKYPLQVNEHASGISPALHPGSAIALFAAYRIDLADHRQTSINIYYEGLRLSASPSVQDGVGNYWMQPRSHQDTVGVTIGIPF
jgi:hypothetical protein